MPGTQMESIKKIIRVRKEDSAFVYFILESYEGITSYSTLDFKQGEAFRDLELRIPADFLEETNYLIELLGELVFSPETANIE